MGDIYLSLVKAGFSKILCDFVYGTCFTATFIKWFESAILDILRQYTDSNPEHRLNQNDLIEILERDYDIKADRKSVKRNLTSLWEMGFLVEWEETRRMYPNKDGEMEESFIQHDFYLDRDPERDFDDSELRLLIDSLLFSKHVPYSQCK